MDGSPKDPRHHHRRHRSRSSPEFRLSRNHTARRIGLSCHRCRRPRRRSLVQSHLYHRRLFHRCRDPRGSDLPCSLLQRGFQSKDVLLLVPHICPWRRFLGPPLDCSQSVPLEFHRCRHQSRIRLTVRHYRDRMDGFRNSRQTSLSDRLSHRCHRPGR